MKKTTLYLASKFFENKFLILFPFLTFVISFSNKAIGQVINASTFPLNVSSEVSLHNFKPIETLNPSRVDDENTILTDNFFYYWFNGIRYSQLSFSVNGVLKLGSEFSGFAFVNNLAINEQYPTKCISSIRLL